jgi:hypothetical protein
MYKFQNLILSWIIVTFLSCKYSKEFSQTNTLENGVVYFKELSSIDNMKIHLFGRVFSEAQGELVLLQDAYLVIRNEMGDTLLYDRSGKDGIDVILPLEPLKISISSPGYESLIINLTPPTIGRVLFIDFGLRRGEGHREFFMHY